MRIPVVFYTKGDGDAVEVTKMNENEVHIKELFCNGNVNTQTFFF